MRAGSAPARTALVLAFAALYGFGDYFAQALLIAVPPRAGGFSNTDIAAVYKALGFAGIARRRARGG